MSEKYLTPGLKRDSIIFLCCKQQIHFHEGDLWERWQNILQPQQLKQKEGTSLHGLSGPQDADERCAQEPHASQGIASMNQFHTALILA